MCSTIRKRIDRNNAARQFAIRVHLVHHMAVLYEKCEPSIARSLSKNYPLASLVWKNYIRRDLVRSAHNLRNNTVGQPLHALSIDKDSLAQRGRGLLPKLRQ